MGVGTRQYRSGLLSCRFTVFAGALPSLQQLRAAGAECNRRVNALPTLIVVILPDNGNDIYSAVKQ